MSSSSSFEKQYNLFSAGCFFLPTYDTSFDTQSAKYIAGGILIWQIVIKLVEKSNIQSEYFPADKKAKFGILTEWARRGDLPKIFWANAYFTLNMKDMLVVSDFDLLEKTFKNPVVCGRIMNPK